MPRFGYETKGATERGCAANYIYGSWFTCLETSTPEQRFSQAVYIRQYGTHTPRIKCAIYRRSDNRLLGESEEWVLTDGWDGWKTFKFPDSLNVVAGEDYWLVIWGNDYYNIYLDSEVGKGMYDEKPYDGIFPDPLEPKTDPPQDHKHSIYCTYEVVVVPTWNLTIEAAPISVPVTINGNPIGNTPITVEVEEGTHTVEVPAEAST